MKKSLAILLFVAMFWGSCSKLTQNHQKLDTPEWIRGVWMEYYRTVLATGFRFTEDDFYFIMDNEELPTGVMESLEYARYTLDEQKSSDFYYFRIHLLDDPDNDIVFESYLITDTLMMVLDRTYTPIDTTFYVKR